VGVAGDVRYFFNQIVEDTVFVFDDEKLGNVLFIGKELEKKGVAGRQILCLDCLLRLRLGFLVLFEPAETAKQQDPDSQGKDSDFHPSIFQQRGTQANRKRDDSGLEKASGERGSRQRIGSGFRVRRKRADLAVDRKQVETIPCFDRFAVVESGNGNAGDVNFLSAGWHAESIAQGRGSNAAARHDFVIFSDSGFDGNLNVRKCIQNTAPVLLECGRAGEKFCGALGKAVEDDVIAQEFVDRSLVLFVPDLLVPAGRPELCWRRTWSAN
jgi:hypothetical protein